MTPKEYYEIKRKEWKDFSGKEWKHIPVYDNPSSRIQERVMRIGALCRALQVDGPTEMEMAFNSAAIAGQMKRDEYWSSLQSTY